MMDSLRNQQNKTIFFFNSAGFHQKSGQLKGFKLRSLQEDKIHVLKTRYVQRTNLLKSKSSLNQREPLTQRPKVNYQNFRYHSLSKRLQPYKKHIIGKSDIIITSQSNSLPKEIKPREFPSFSSSNLEGKMNEYLNLIIKKSHDSHKDKIKKMMQVQKQPRQTKVQNMFLRRMKMNQNRKKQVKQDVLDQQSKNIYSIQMLNNLKDIIRKQSGFSFEENKE